MTSEQIRAARAILRMDQATLAKTADISVETVKRLEKMDGPILGATISTVVAIRAALESAGVQFVDDGDVAGGKGVVLRK